MWTLKLDEVRALTPAEIAGTLSHLELQRAEGIGHVETRLQFIGGRWLLRQLLTRTLVSRSPRQWEFTFNACGKPSLVGFAGMHFNISHTQGLIVCALSEERAIGVDIESLKRQVSWREVAGDYFTPREIDDIEDTTPQAQCTKFFKYWTLKESLLKAMGLGFTAQPRNISFLLAPDVQVHFAPRFLYQDPTAWQFQLFEFGGEYQGALALKADAGGERAEIRVRQGIAALSPLRLNYSP